MPKNFKELFNGKSNYFKTNYRDNVCNELKTKKEKVDFIEDGYIDGNCIKYKDSEYYA